MVDESPMPPDRAKTVHNNEQTRSVTFNANDDCQRLIRDDAGAAKLNLTQTDLNGQQPPKPLPPPEPPPAPPRQPWPGTDNGISYSTLIRGEDGADQNATR